MTSLAIAGLVDPDVKIAKELKKNTTIKAKETMKTNKSERVTVRINGELGTAIREIQDATSMTSPSEVVRRALLIHHTLVKQKMMGNEPVIIDKENGKEKQVPIFL